MNRYFVRCPACLAVAALDADRTPYGVRCDVCHAPTENMGRVSVDHLVTEHTACKCDERCTCARGPICSCQCGGKNHGVGLLAGTVIVQTPAGPVPQLTPRDPFTTSKLRAQADRWLKARADIANELAALQARKARGEYLGSTDYRRMSDLRKGLRKAHEARTPAGRTKIYAALMPQAPEPTPAEVRAILSDLHAVTSQDAGPIAEVPFRLAQPIAKTTAKQITLF